jgi:hypothetical protein
VLARGEGLALYREVAAQFARLPGIDAKALHGLAERLARPAEEQAYELALSFLRGWLSRLACHAALAPAVEMLPGEEKVLTRLAAPGQLERWAELWETSSALISRTDALFLDRKQTILSIVYAAARVAGGSRIHMPAPVGP